MFQKKVKRKMWQYFSVFVKTGIRVYKAHTLTPLPSPLKWPLAAKLKIAIFGLFGQRGGVLGLKFHVELDFEVIFKLYSLPKTVFNFLCLKVVFIT